MSPPFRLIEIPGNELAPWLDALGHLRINVFREFPYLYDGTADYEREYLSVYQKCPRSKIVIAFDHHDQPIGATTCMPLAEESPAFREPFEQAGLDPKSFLYLGESVVLPNHRGSGLGTEFFKRREQHAKLLGLSKTTFCAVDRPTHHPQRPPGYRPLDDFWSRMGYAKQAHLHTSFPWKEIGEEAETSKTLTFWTKSWTA